MKSVLVPLDGSELAARALTTAVVLARASGSALRLLRVVPAPLWLNPDLEPVRGAAVTTAEKELADAALPIRTSGLDVTVRVETGRPADRIVAAAAELGTDLIVMSTHGRGGLGRWYYGSVADEVLRRSPVPVMLVHATAQDAAPAASGGRVVVPLDGSAFGEVALEPAVELARTLAADVVLLRVVQPFNPGAYADPYGSFTPMNVAYDVEADAAEARAYLASVAARLQGSGVEVGERVEIGDPAALLASVAREVAGSVIAMATHGRTGVARFALGSTATATLQHAAVPVLLARPEQLVHPVAIEVPAVVARADGRAHPVAAATSIDLSAADIAMVRYGLDLLVGTVDRDHLAMAAVQDLADRLDAAVTGAREPVGGGAR